MVGKSCSVPSLSSANPSAAGTTANAFASSVSPSGSSGTREMMFAHPDSRASVSRRAVVENRSGPINKTSIARAVGLAAAVAAIRCAIRERGQGQGPRRAGVATVDINDGNARLRKIRRQDRWKQKVERPLTQHITAWRQAPHPQQQDECGRTDQSRQQMASQHGMSISAPLLR